jgi:hypothetical protein
LSDKNHSSNTETDEIKITKKLHLTDSICNTNKIILKINTNKLISSKTLYFKFNIVREYNNKSEIIYTTDKTISIDQTTFPKLKLANIEYFSKKQNTEKFNYNLLTYVVLRIQIMNEVTKANDCHVLLYSNDKEVSIINNKIDIDSIPNDSTAIIDNSLCFKIEKSNKKQFILKYKILYKSKFEIFSDSTNIIIGNNFYNTSF